MSTRRGRWCKRIALTLLGLGCVLALTLTLLLGTAPGRGLVLDVALSLLNRSLPGDVSAASLDRLDEGGVSLRELRVRDPSGAEVAHLELLTVEWDLFAALGGRLVIHEVSLTGGFVDLREASGERGLSAALVAPDEVPDADDDGSPGAPPYVRVDRLTVHDLAVFGPELPTVGALDLRGVELVGSFELDGQPQARLEHGAATLTRAGEALGAVRALRGALTRGASPSSLTLAGELAGSPLRLELSVVLPPEPTWRQRELQGTLELAGLPAPALALLLDSPEHADAYHGRLTYRVEAAGTPEDLTLRSVLATAGGDVHLDAHLRSNEAHRLRLHTNQLVPSALRADLPSRALDLELEVDVDLGGEEDARPLSVRLGPASWGGERLPSVDLTALLGPSSLSELRLNLTDAQSRLEAQGHVAFDGTGDLQGSANIHAETLQRVLALLGVASNADGRTSLRFRAVREEPERFSLSGQLDTGGIAIGDHAVGSAHLRWIVRGLPLGTLRSDWPPLEVDVAARLEEARVAGREVQRAYLTLRGGPERYGLTLGAVGQSAHFHADLSAQRLDGAIALQGTARGAHDGVPIQASLAETRVRFDGSVTTRGLELWIAGQRLDLEGSASSTELDLRLRTGPLLLSKLGEALRLPSPLVGQLNLQLAVTGPPRAPSLRLQSTLLEAAVGARPPLDFLLDGHLDATQGHMALELTARSSSDALPPDGDAADPPAPIHPDTPHPGATNDRASERPTGRLQVKLEGSYDFPGGPSWTNDLTRGDGSLTFDLGAFDLALVERWIPGTSLPITGSVRATLEARGGLASPEIDAHVDADLRRKGSEVPLNLSTFLRLDRDSLSAFGRLGDPNGSLADLALTATLPSPPGNSTSNSTSSSPSNSPSDGAIARWATLLSDGRWTLHLRSPERDLRHVGFVTPSAALPPLAYALDLTVHHEPQQEPEGVLRAHARQLAPYPSDNPCTGGPVHVDLEARLAEGRLWVETQGGTAAARWFEAAGGLELSLAAALAGGAVRTGPLDAHLLAQRVQLASLPLLCDRVHGELTARAWLHARRGDAPHLEVELDARQVTLGAPPPIDLQLRARATADDADVVARIFAPGGASELRASLPLQWKQGVLTLSADAPLRGRMVLRHLTLAPLIPSSAPISYVTGTLDGHVALGGTLGAPTLDGTLELHDVGFTATDVAQPLQNVQGRLRFTERSLHVEELRAVDRDGSLAIDGQVTFDDPEHIRARFDITTRKFPLRQLGQVLATVDADAQVHTEVHPEQTDVRVTVEDVHLWIENTDVRRGLSLDPHPDFAIDGQAPPSSPARDLADVAAPAPPTPEPRAPEAPSPKAPAPASRADAQATADARVTRVDVETRGHFWVNRDDFAVRLSADLLAEDREGAMTVRGEVSIDRGYVMLLGRVFDLEKDSRLEFVGTSPPDPTLDLTAVHENRRSGRRISLHIGGRSSQPELTFFVDGARADAGAALLAIYGSQRTIEDPKTAERQAAGFVGGLTAGLLATSARRRLGAAAPILMIDPGDSLGEGRLRAGFELDPLVPRFLRDFITGVYFEGIVAREGTRSDTGAGTQATPRDSRLQGGVLLEFYFPDGFFNTNQYGPGATWSVDLGWQL